MEALLGEEHMKISTGWSQLDAVAKETHNRAEVAIAESKEAAEAIVDQESSLAMASAATRHWKEAETNCKVLQDE
ncbi:hypothetical protein D1007_46686 [Hordeum vulgare]|nr:hypothetical protein D1007_46686 [Hordeum vulgare]